MKGFDFLQKMSDVDTDLVAEAENAFTVRKIRRTNYIKKGIAIAACVCLVFGGTVPALAAAGSDTAYEALYSVAPAIAQKLKPVNASCEDQGIVMELIAADIEGENANILLSMRDESGSRLDENSDIFDSYSIHTPYDQSGGCSFVSYDADTKTATYMLTIEQMNHVLIPGDKITFSVSRLLGKKEYSNLALTQIDTANVPSVENYAAEPDIRGGSMADGAAADWDKPMLMQPDEANAVSLLDGVALTGYGLVDGKLHVQVRFDDILKTDNHGFISLKTRDGEVIDSAFSIAFWDDSQVNSYEEFVFPISAEELADCEVWGEFWTCNDGPIEGNWEVTFPITEKE